MPWLRICSMVLFFLNDCAASGFYTLSLHDALPIFVQLSGGTTSAPPLLPRADKRRAVIPSRDRKSTRLNSSHQIISYAVFCLKKKPTGPVQGIAQRLDADGALVLRADSGVETSVLA